MAKKDKIDKKSNHSGVITIRVSHEVDKALNSLQKSRRLNKAQVIRIYLEMARYLDIDPDFSSIKSYNENEMLLIKKNYFKDVMASFDEVKQIDWGTELAQFINDLARIEEKLEDMNYKLNLCEHFGLFPKKIDKGGYILVPKIFAPERFVDAFVWMLIKMGDEGDFNKAFIESEMDGNKKLRRSYKDTVQPVRRSGSHYSYEYANINKIKVEE